VHQGGEEERHVAPHVGQLRASASLPVIDAIVPKSLRAKAERAPTDRPFRLTGALAKVAEKTPLPGPRPAGQTAHSLPSAAIHRLAGEVVTARCVLTADSAITWQPAHRIDRGSLG
jgi:hypothetical protein